MADSTVLDQASADVLQPASVSASDAAVKPQQANSSSKTGASNSDADVGVAKFFSPENKDFSYEMVYFPLATGEEGDAGCDFRLVRILAGSGDDTIRCRLLPSKLCAETKYEALSYCAGAADDCCRISLNGHSFNTFRSTCEAIKRFRHCQEDVIMWIDQICINQADIRERDSQVLLMRDIYKHAARTQIWLGEAAIDPPSNLAFVLVRRFLVENHAMLRQHIMETAAAQTEIPALRSYLYAEDLWLGRYAVVQTQLRERRQVEARKDPTLHKVYKWFCKACRDPWHANSWDSRSHRFELPWRRRRQHAKGWDALFQLFERPWWRRCWIGKFHALYIFCAWSSTSLEIPTASFISSSVEGIRDGSANLDTPLPRRVYSLFRRQANRVRSVQEAAVSGRLVINCGGNWVVWENLSLFFAAWSMCDRMWDMTTFQEEDLTMSMRACFTVLQSIHAWRRSSTGITLVSYLSLLRNNLASDPRDKVYSVLGLLAPKSRQDYAIVPNYMASNTVTEVYIEAAIAILHADHELQLFVSVSGHESAAGLPTWVPDWSRPLISAFPEVAHYFDAGSSRPVVLEILEDERQLKLHGYLIDNIEAIGPANTDDAMGMVTTWQTLVVQRMPHENDLHLLDAFYRTVGYNCWTTDTGDPSGNATQFKNTWDRALSHSYPTRIRDRSRFFMSNGNTPGMAPACAQANDEIFIPWGSGVPLVVRRLIREGDRFQLIGPCYLHGMMYGEVFTLEEEDKIKSEDIYLV